MGSHKQAQLRSYQTEIRHTQQQVVSGDTGEQYRPV
jgi:hypothetical protein